MAKSGYRIMDSDLHVMEPADIFEGYLEGPFKARAPQRVVPDSANTNNGWRIGELIHPPFEGTERFRKRNAKLRTLKRESPEHMEAAAQEFDATATLRAMDIEGVDVGVLYRSAAGLVAIGVDDLDPEFAFALTRAYNNWLADFCKADPDRLKGAAVIPLRNIEMAVEETRRAATELGFVGITLYPEPVDGRLLYDPEVDPLWAELERLGLAVGVHGSSNAPAREDITRKYFNHPAGGTLTHSMSFAVQLQAAMGGMIFSGVLERFPKLRVAFLEGNCGWLPWWLQRMDDQWEKYGVSEEGAILSMKPSDYFLRNCFISMDPDEELATEVIRRIGDDNIVLSTDFPHLDSAFPHAIDEFMELDLSSESRRKVLWGNCARFYNLEEAKP